VYDWERVCDHNSHHRCGHCKALATDWERLAGHTKTTSALRAHATVAKIDAEAERGIRDKYGVHSYPTILVFPPAKFGVSEPKVMAHLCIVHIVVYIWYLGCLCCGMRYGG
jgi:hypothetical protein